MHPAKQRHPRLGSAQSQSLSSLADGWLDCRALVPGRIRRPCCPLLFVAVALFFLWYGLPLAVGATPPVQDVEEARQEWAFRTPRVPALPQVKGSSWPQNPVDYFILAKLEALGLTPAPPADKRTLIRRATFDLIGLPPTRAEVEEFLDDAGVNAFEKVVERLLNSPRHGEHWGRHWLDQVRYADSVDKRQIGQPGDINEAYRYRDWVVNAFNQDMPYDQFVLRQFAGDLLPGDSSADFDAEGIIATSMLAIGRWEQGEADKEKMMTDIVDDQIDVLGRTFLGLTLACARCHDHKFDPITTRDYYALAGAFYSSHVIPEVGGKGGDTQRLRIPLDTPAELKRRKQREVRMAELENQIAQTLEEAVAMRARELFLKADHYLTAAAEYRMKRRAQPGLTAAGFARERAGGATLNPELFEAWTGYLGFAELNLLSKRTTDYMAQRGLLAWQSPEAADTPWAIVNRSDRESSFAGIRFPPRSVALHPSPKAGVAVSWKSPVNGLLRVTGRIADAHNSCGDGVGWELKKGAAGQLVLLSEGSIPNGGAQNLTDGTGTAKARAIEVRAGEVIQLAVMPKAEHGCDSTLVELEIAEMLEPNRVWNLARDLAGRVATIEPSNPCEDRFGHPAVWHFHDLADPPSLRAVARESLLARWFETAELDGASAELEKTALQIQQALERADAARSKRRQAGLAALGRSLETSTDEEWAALAKKLFEGNTTPTDDAGIEQLYRDLTEPRSRFRTRLRSRPAHLSNETQLRLAQLRDELAQLQRNPPPPPAFAHGIREGGVPKSDYAGIQDTRIQIRGRYDRLGEVVPRRAPNLFYSPAHPPMTNGSGRLQLARWIASPENPLTARVMMNRIWQFHFGEGIVRTPSNYGKLGQPPTHPELLDYLSRRFIESGWSIKAMHRLILLSATYQQSSAVHESTVRLDPDNRWFGRMNRRRLTAEALRDSLLAVNGSLDLTPGGPPVKDLNQPRRTLYLMTVRSDGSSYRTLFDAADPTAIVEQRTSSTVAPQALFLLNNPFALAQAGKLAQFVQRDGPHAASARIDWLYHRLFGRAPTEREVAAALAALASPTHDELPAPARQSLDPAWERYCQVLLCANEFLYID